MGIEALMFWLRARRARQKSVVVVVFGRFRFITSSRQLVDATELSGQRRQDLTREACCTAREACSSKALQIVGVLCSATWHEYGPFESLRMPIRSFEHAGGYQAEAAQAAEGSGNDSYMPSIKLNSLRNTVSR